MANPPVSKIFQAITVPAEGPLLDLIRRHAHEADLPLGRAVLSLLERRDPRAVTLVESPSALPAIAAIAGAIADAPIEELMAELGRRVAAASPEELAEANTRAAAAETKLAAVTAALTGASA
ncbi:MAG: hypothetical protein V4659_00520 [Pseudomonadota bacterium]